LDVSVGWRQTTLAVISTNVKDSAMNIKEKGRVAMEIVKDGY